MHLLREYHYLPEFMIIKKTLYKLKRVSWPDSFFLLLIVNNKETNKSFHPSVWKNWFNSSIIYEYFIDIGNT